MDGWVDGWWRCGRGGSRSRAMSSSSSKSCAEETWWFRSGLPLVLWVVGLGLVVEVGGVTEGCSIREGSVG